MPVAHPPLSCDNQKRLQTCPMSTGGRITSSWRDLFKWIMALLGTVPLGSWGGGLEYRASGGGGRKTLVTQENVHICPSLQPWPDYHLFCFSKHQWDNALSWVLCCFSISHHCTTSDMLMRNPRVLCGWKGFQQQLSLLSEAPLSSPS